MVLWFKNKVPSGAALLCIVIKLTRLLSALVD